MKTLLVTKASTVIDNVATAKNIREDRRSRKITISACANRMGISSSYYCDLEMGNRNWTPQLVARYQEAVK